MSRTDEVTRLINASPMRVFEALSTADAVAEWLPPDGMTARIDHFDAQAGGGYRMVLVYRDATGAPGKSSATEDVVEGRFVEVVPGVRLVQEVEFESDDPRYAGVMRMTWEVRASGSDSEVTFRAEDVPEGISAADHEMGLSSSLRNLAELLSAQL
ncbi:SRPBCC domain-containing protein [Microbacterium sp. A82]|uniref:SRPBCC domain-containing protein n=1 Tax=Microbacterium sp. A82 TaxID=3450452 RepID=UPI003F3E1168